jgi:hypothetical protein
MSRLNEPVVAVNDSRAITATQFAELPHRQWGRRGKLNGHARVGALSTLRVSGYGWVGGRRSTLVGRSRARLKAVEP